MGQTEKNSLRANIFRVTPESGHRSGLALTANVSWCRIGKPLVDAAMAPITCGLCRAREVWIDDALGGAARCRRVALRQRRVAAFVIVGSAAVHVQANRISRIVRLGRRWPYRDRPDRQNRQSQNAHRNLPWEYTRRLHPSLSARVLERSIRVGFTSPPAVLAKGAFHSQNIAGLLSGER